MPYCFPRSHRTKNCWFWPELSVSGLQFEFTDGFEMMHKASCSIVEVAYYFFRSSIKSQGHRGWKMYDLNPIWVRLLGRSQLSNPSDLPCSQIPTLYTHSLVVLGYLLLVFERAYRGRVITRLLCTKHMKLYPQRVNVCWHQYVSCLPQSTHTPLETCGWYHMVGMEHGSKGFKWRFYL